jgi:hypothetical protein
LILEGLDISFCQSGAQAGVPALLWCPETPFREHPRDLDRPHGFMVPVGTHLTRGVFDPAASCDLIATFRCLQF